MAAGNLVLPVVPVPFGYWVPRDWVAVVVGLCYQVGRLSSYLLGICLFWLAPTTLDFLWLLAHFLFSNY